MTYVNTPANMDKEKLILLLADVNRTISISKELILANRLVELTGLDASIGRICAQALDLPPADSLSFRNNLTILLTRLDELLFLIKR